MAFDDAESLFYMKPAAVIEGLARQFVADQIAIAKIRTLADSLPAGDPKVAELRAQAAEVIQNWVSKGVPNLAASFRLALEVLDTHGPEGVRVEDAVDAGIWNNKYFVWLKEFGGSTPE